MTDRIWARGTYAQHTVLGRYAPTYAYEFADRRAPMYLPSSAPFDFSAYHASDTAYVFEDETARSRFTAAQVVLGNRRRLLGELRREWRTDSARPAAVADVRAGRGRAVHAVPCARAGSQPRARWTAATTQRARQRVAGVRRRFLFRLCGLP
ncbi:hypothetical protein ABZZ20_24175 [Streptomyces sp. NPDC006430]|uniref:hypothetical protein n=1 Tax=Streptomyces sp. NPDC006430 TaxID=3154299 RepID=UPI0033A64503